MTQATLQAELQSHGITASADKLAGFVAEAVAAMEVGALMPAASELPESELEVLRGGGFEVSVGALSGDDAIARAAATYSALLATAFTIKQVAQALQRNESRIRQRLLQRTIYGVRHGRGWLLPRFQFQIEAQGAGHVVTAMVPGIERVFPLLDPELHPVSVWRWFTSPSTELVAEQSTQALSPRDWLLAGHELASVMNLARDL
jgi:hypothetical protein